MPASAWRQYCAFARIVYGQKVHDFFAMLVAAGFATAYAAAHERARILPHPSQDALRAIGEPDSRLRQADALARAVERLMLLDAVLADPSFDLARRPNATSSPTSHACTSVPAETSCRT